MTGKMTTSPILTQSGRALLEKEDKQWLLNQIKWFKEFLKRNPNHSDKVWPVIENFYQMYKK